MNDEGFRRDERFRDDDGKLDLGKIKWHEDGSYKVLLLERYIDEQQATIEKQELRLQQLEELLELSENLNKSYREKLIDMNLKMVIDDE